MKKLNFKKLIAVISLLSTTASVASLGAYAGGPNSPISGSSQSNVTPTNEGTTPVDGVQPIVTDNNEQNVANVENESAAQPTYTVENSWKSLPVFNKLSTTALITNPNRDEANPVEFKLNENDLNGFTKAYIKKPDTLKLSKKSAYELIHINDFSGFKQLMYEANPANNLNTPLNKFSGYAKRPKVDKKKEEAKPKKENSSLISNTYKKTCKTLANMYNSLKKVWTIGTAVQEAIVNVITPNTETNTVVTEQPTEINTTVPEQNAETNTVATEQNAEANTVTTEQNTNSNSWISYLNPFSYFKK